MYSSVQAERLSSRNPIGQFRAYANNCQIYIPAWAASQYFPRVEDRVETFPAVAHGADKCHYRLPTPAQPCFGLDPLRRIAGTIGRRIDAVINKMYSMGRHPKEFDNIPSGAFGIHDDDAGLRKRFAFGAQVPTMTPPPARPPKRRAGCHRVVSRMNIVNPVDIVPTTIAAVYDDLASPRRRDPRPPSAGSIKNGSPRR